AQPSNDASVSNHVVIGAFANRENAVHFTDEAKKNHPSVKFEMNPNRQLYYVYVQKTDNRVQAFAEARKLRKESKYWDTWVFYGALGESQIEKKVISNKNSKPASIKEKGDALVTEKTVVDEQQAEKMEAQIKAYSMAEEPAGLDLDKMIGEAQGKEQKERFEVIKEIKESASQLDASTKVIVFKDDKEGREALLALGYEIDEDKPIAGFFDSKNNILAINASEGKVDEPFHEGLKPVVKFLKKKNPALFEEYSKRASEMNHPTKGKTYAELTGTPEEALGNMMADVANGFFDNAKEARVEATSLMKDILGSLGVEPLDLSLSTQHLKTTANNLAVAVREATGFDAEGNRRFKFLLYNTQKLNKVNDEVDLVNEAGRKLFSYPGNELVIVRKADASANIILACEVMGYRKLLFKLNYDNPFLTEGVTRGDDEEAIVPFGLVRLQKGDIAVMYNVYFFKDAAIMRSESRYEINNLLDMMKENTAYRIMIHGHTNGNSAGKIITIGDSKNYFSLSDTKDGRGSAKKLSEQRAEVIREYMMDQGIGADRMEIKAWGGKRPLYDKNHSLAQSNVRVEIEIIEN
ncbi:MAG TPA: OmpA family protein, partial [Cyclobacteriaceae bacterium]